MGYGNWYITSIGKKIKVNIKLIFLFKILLLTSIKTCNFVNMNLTNGIV